MEEWALSSNWRKRVIQEPKSTPGYTSSVRTVKKENTAERIMLHVSDLTRISNKVTSRLVACWPAACEASSRWSCWRRPGWRWRGERRPLASVQTSPVWMTAAAHLKLPGYAKTQSVHRALTRMRSFIDRLSKSLNGKNKWVNKFDLKTVTWEKKVTLI